MAKQFTEEFLLSELQRYYSEFNKVPTSKDFDRLEPKTYPSRRTFANYFGDFNKAVELAGFESIYSWSNGDSTMTVKERELRKTKEYWIESFYALKEKLDRVPTAREMDSEYNYGAKRCIRILFGGYNNLLSELNEEINQVSQYTDEFLELEFRRFVNTYNRVPTTMDFNKTEYPSFWCYQERFGCWNKAVMNYGYTPNDDNTKTYMEDGEVCYSSFEFKVTTLLQELNVNYERDIKYVTFIDNYKGKMDCDYVIDIDGKKIYLEVAGFIRSKGKQTERQIPYIRKIKYKEKLLIRQQLPYLILYGEDSARIRYENKIKEFLINNGFPFTAQLN